MRVVFCFILLGLGRAVNVLIPYCYKLIGMSSQFAIVICPVESIVQLTDYVVVSKEIIRDVTASHGICTLCLTY